MLHKAEKVTFPALKKLRKVTFVQLELAGPNFLKPTEAYNPTFVGAHSHPLIGAARNIGFMNVYWGLGLFGKLT